MTKKILPFVFAICLLLPAQIWGAQTAQETLKNTIDEMLSVLSTPAKKGTPAYQTERDKLMQIIGGIFDFEELSARAVGVHWKRFSDAQKQEFIKDFSGLLRGKYLDRIQAYSNESVEYGDIRTSSRGNVEVHTRIVQSNNTIPIAYRMTETDTGWKVYDVVIEGVSLVKNYRSQFMEILVNGKPEDLLSALKKKIGQNSN